VSAGMASEVREILAHAHDESDLRHKLEQLCEIHEKENPYDDDLYEFGVAFKAPRRKTWILPKDGEHGSYAQASSELAAMLRVPSTVAKLVKRPKVGHWVDA
jgi:hypothetical protein